jgi:protein-tyrosine-phosphatase
MHVTFVCEANRARSPLAEVLWRHELAVRGLDGWTTSSAGVRAQPDMPVLSGLLVAAERFASPLRAHRSRPLDEELVASSDLILTMTRDQADRIGSRYADVARRLFVLGELTGLLTFRTEALPTGADAAGVADAAPDPVTSAPEPAPASSAPTPEQRIAAATQRRILRGLRDDDVADPADPRNPMAEAVTIIDRHVRTLADELLG